MRRRNKLPKRLVDRLTRVAWKVREFAYVLGDTKVGCAVLSSSGKVAVGCNVEHRFRCHDIHAEVNAITSMVASGQRKLVAVVIVAEREHFVPCGGCMDWIMQFGSADTIILFQNERKGSVKEFSAKQLMPHYPR